MGIIALTGYVISVIDEKRICVRVDEEFIQKVCRIETEAKHKNTYRDVLTINVKNAKYNISIPWDNLNSLIGMHIKTTLNYREYSFYTTHDVLRDDGITEQIKKHIIGVTYTANHIKNVVEA